METTQEANGPAFFILREEVKPKALKRGDVIIPKKASRYLEQDDAFIGSDECPPVYFVKAVEDNGRKVVVEAQDASGGKRKTFHMDRGKKVGIIPAKVVWSMRASESRRETEQLQQSGESLRSVSLDPTPVMNVRPGDIIGSSDVVAFMEAGGALGAEGCPPTFLVEETRTEGESVMLTVSALDRYGQPSGDSREIALPRDVDVLVVSFGASVTSITRNEDD
jgi:hypothetical protein